MDFVIPSPLQEVDYLTTCQLQVKRDDLIHRDLSGNKYRKLIGHVDYIIKNHVKGIVTFGGAFSNHLYSCAAFAKKYNLLAIGIVRGEDDVSNPTLQYCRSMGMELFFVTRQEYSLKQESKVIRDILVPYDDYYLIPEGGDHPLAMSGLSAMIDEVIDPPDYIAVSAGTGSTAIGILKAMIAKGWKTKLMVLPALKHSGIKDRIIADTGVPASQFVYADQYTFGGYAKSKNTLIAFINDFYSKTHIPLDPVYNGKLVYGLTDLDQKGFFKSNERIIWIHTGGLQGIHGYNYLTKKGDQAMIHPV